MKMIIYDYFRHFHDCLWLTMIKNGDIMGLGDSGLLAVGKDIDSTLIEMLDEMMKEND